MTPKKFIKLYLGLVFVNYQVVNVSKEKINLFKITEDVLTADNKEWSN